MTKVISTENICDIYNNTYEARLLNGAMEFAKERRLELSTCMVSSVVTLQDLVDTLEEKRPKVVQRSKVEDTVRDVSRVMRVGSYSIFAVKLHRRQT